MQTSLGEHIYTTTIICAILCAVLWGIYWLHPFLALLVSAYYGYLAMGLQKLSMPTEPQEVRLRKGLVTSFLCAGLSLIVAGLFNMTSAATFFWNLPWAAILVGSFVLGELLGLLDT